MALAVFFMVAGNPDYQGPTFIGPEMVQADDAGEVVSLTPPINTAHGGATLEDIIKNFVNFIFWLGIIICPILIVWGGFNIATSAGSEDKMKKGRDTITFAVIGLVIIAISNVMVSAIQNILK